MDCKRPHYGQRQLVGSQRQAVITLGGVRAPQLLLETPDWNVHALWCSLGGTAATAFVDSIPNPTSTQHVPRSLCVVKCKWCMQNAYDHSHVGSHCSLPAQQQIDAVKFYDRGPCCRVQTLCVENSRDELSNRVLRPAAAPGAHITLLSDSLVCGGPSAGCGNPAAGLVQLGYTCSLPGAFAVGVAVQLESQRREAFPGVYSQA